MSMLRRWRSRGSQGNGQVPVRTEEEGEMSDPILDFEARLDDLFDDFLEQMENTLGMMTGPRRRARHQGHPEKRGRRGPAPMERSPAMEPTRTREGRFQPRVDFSETDEAYMVRADLPGMSRDDIEVTVSDNVVMIRGERSEESEQQHGDYHYQERQYGMFRRSFDLPSDVQADNVSATFQDGVLTVQLPKSEEAKKSRRRIDISS